MNAPNPPRLLPTVLCVTPNPAIDRTLVVPDFAVGRVLRPIETVVAAGGKGSNVARALQILGGRPLLVGLLGGHAGRWLADLAEQERIPAAWTWYEGTTRTCTMIVTDGTATVLNETATVTEADWQRFVADIAARAPDAALLAVSGSLPRGVPNASPADLIAVAGEAQRPIWFDTSGQALQSALAARPGGLKINSDEAADIVGFAVDSPLAAVAAGRRFREAGIESVVITLGREGAALVDRSGAYLAQPPDVAIASAVGSGDAFFAGLLHAMLSGKSSADALRWGVAAGTANAMSVGGGSFALDTFESVLAATRIQTVDSG